MFVNDEVLRAAEAELGKPAAAEFRVDTTSGELAFIRRTQKRGRAHDVTLVIPDRLGRFAVIAKHHYPFGAFRLPSGGAEPGEALVAGAIREAAEETGLVVKPSRYLLLARVRFDAIDPEDEGIDWTTHVLETEPAAGVTDPQDTREIREAAWMDREELLGPNRERLLEMDAAGIRYRVQLHAAIFGERDRRGEPGE